MELLTLDAQLVHIATAALFCDHFDCLAQVEGCIFRAHAEVADVAAQVSVASWTSRMCVGIGGCTEDERKQQETAEQQQKR